MKALFILLPLAAFGCAEQNAQVRSPASENVAAAAEPRSTDVGGFLVTMDDTCPQGHSCDIIDVVDIHTKAKSQDKGFDELRSRARNEGGNAVIGAEFEHGDGDEPSHLSGMVVRWGQPVPPYVEIGKVDVPSEEKNEDKGLQELIRRGREMGGDQVIDVTFEHGDDGALGHLRGRVVRYTK